MPKSRHKNYLLLDPGQAHGIYAQLPIIVMYGRNEADLLQLLHYWLQKSPKMKGGRAWVYNTYQEWHDQLPYMSVSTIRRAFAKLKELDVVLIEKFNTGIETDNTRWFSINYKTIAEDFPEMYKNPSVQNEQTEISNTYGDDNEKQGKEPPNPIENQSVHFEQTSISNSYDENDATPSKSVCSFWADGSPIADPLSKEDTMDCEDCVDNSFKMALFNLNNPSVQNEQTYKGSSIPPVLEEKEEEKREDLTPNTESVAPTDSVQPSTPSVDRTAPTDPSPPDPMRSNFASPDDKAQAKKFYARVADLRKSLFGVQGAYGNPAKIDPEFYTALDEYGFDVLMEACDCLEAVNMDLAKSGKPRDVRYLKDTMKPKSICNCISDHYNTLVEWKAMGKPGTAKPDRRAIESRISYIRQDVKAGALDPSILDDVERIAALDNKALLETLKRYEVKS